VVDRVERAQVQRALALLGAARRGDHLSAPEARDLHRRAADAAARRVDEHGLARHDAAARDEHVPRREERERPRRRLLERHRGRLAQEVRRGDDRVLGAAAVARLAEDPVLLAEVVLAREAAHADAARVAGRDAHLVARLRVADGGSGFEDDAREVAAEDHRQRERVAGHAAAHPHVEVVHARRADAEQHLVRRGRRDRPLLDRDLVESAVLAHDRAAHRPSHRHAPRNEGVLSSRLRLFAGGLVGAGAATGPSDE
jgi:hypothetical protein